MSEHVGACVEGVCRCMEGIERTVRSGRRLNDEAVRWLLEHALNLQAEAKSAQELVIRQGDQLTRIVNAVRGEPDFDGWHSHHDAAELVERMARTAEWIPIGRAK